jgi:hypothetical protein
MYPSFSDPCVCYRYQLCFIVIVNLYVVILVRQHVHVYTDLCGLVLG